MAFIDTLFTRQKNAQGFRLISIATRLAVWRSRRALSRLDARQLKDIGICVEDARREAALALWDVPPNWISK